MYTHIHSYYMKVDILPFKSTVCRHGWFADEVGCRRACRDGCRCFTSTCCCSTNVLCICIITVAVSCWFTCYVGCGCLPQR